MKQLSMAVLLVGLAQSSACGEMFEKCDARALPIRGAYALSESTDAFESMRIDVGKEEVEMSYTRADGSKWKARYRISARGKGWR